MAVPAAVLADFIKRFSPAAAEGLSAVYQLHLTGDGGDVWHIIIAEQKCQLAAGPGESPDVAITISVDDWEGLIAGRLDPFSAYISGRLGIAGDLSLATRLATLFGL
jgi:putative sterol carrier protein